MVKWKNFGTLEAGNNKNKTGLKALLFINGEPPKQLPDTRGFDVIACTDGAFLYLKAKNFPLEQLDFVSGDFDSFPDLEAIPKEKIIVTPNQDETDFHKALTNLREKGIRKVDVYGGSGGEMDHFLGNLSVAYRFWEEMEIVFYDAYAEYRFIPKNFKLNGVKGRMISLYPFPIAKGIMTKGLHWGLSQDTLSITDRIGTRNFAIEDEITISYQEGAILLFLGEQYK